jgi:hypothetical protein
MLNAHLEVHSLQALIDQGIVKPLMTAISACKENIDRGGMENTKYMYIRLPKNNNDKLSLLTGVMHSRALSARDRVILKKRMPQVLDFMRLTDPDEFRKDMKDLLKFESIDYSLKTLVQAPPPAAAAAA